LFGHEAHAFQQAAGSDSQKRGAFARGTAAALGTNGSMTKRIASWLWLVLVQLVIVPVTVIATFLLNPLWSWIEARFGVEAIGHTAPAEWCFITIYGLLLFIAVIVLATSKMRGT
jgi:hypothetical protein